MALSTLLYRCPRCGHDPLEGRGDAARCRSCGAEFARGGGGATVRVVDARGEERAPAAALTSAIARFGGPLPTAGGRTADPEAGDHAAPVDAPPLFHEAEVIRSRSVVEEPVWHRGRLLGYAERQGEGEEGTLRLVHEEIHFLRREEVVDQWALLDLRALQSSSALVQLSVVGGELVQFRFRSDSPRRWEDLLRLAIQRAWSDAGRGTIIEFQPRIAAR